MGRRPEVLSVSQTFLEPLDLHGLGADLGMQLPDEFLLFGAGRIEGLLGGFEKALLPAFELRLVDAAARRGLCEIAAALKHVEDNGGLAASLPLPRIAIRRRPGKGF